MKDETLERRCAPIWRGLKKPIPASSMRSQSNCGRLWVQPSLLHKVNRVDPSSSERMAIEQSPSCSSAAPLRSHKGLVGASFFGEQLLEQFVF